MSAKRPADAPTHPWPNALRVAALKRAQPTPFDLSATADQQAAIAGFLGLLGLDALRFRGQVAEEGEDGWRVTGRLTANVVQECVATLDPVPARIDQQVSRLFVPTFAGTVDLDPEDDDDPDEYTDTIDPGAVALEELALALDPYPRAADADPVDARAAPRGAQPLEDAELKPFAGLAALRDKMQGGR